MCRERTIPIVAVLLFSCACAGVQRGAVVIPLDGAKTQVVSYPAELRGVYVKPDGEKLRFCAEPAPDVALSTLQKITANLKAAGKVEGGLSSEASASVIQLAGRTQLVLLTRELLYRACELESNETGGGVGNAQELYAQVVKLIETLGQSEKTDADTKHIEAVTKSTALQFEMMQLKSDRK